MGCGGSKEVETAEIGACATPFTAEQTLTGQAPPTSAGKYESRLTLFPLEITVKNLTSNTTMGRAKAISLMNLEFEGLDLNGKRESVFKQKTLQLMPEKKEHRSLRFTPAYEGQVSSEYASDDKAQAAALYNFAKAVGTNSLGGGEGEYGLYTSGEETTIMLKGKRNGRGYLFFDMAGTCVAKAMTAHTGKVTTFEIAGGVDPDAVMMLRGALAPSKKNHG